MNAKKIAILTLVILVIAFVAGIGSPLLMDSRDQNEVLTEEEAMKKAKELMNSWVASLNKALDFLSPSLNVGRMKPVSPCRFKEKIFRLRDNKTCLIPVSKKGDDDWNWRDFEKAVLKPQSTKVNLKVCYCEKRGHTSERGPAADLIAGKRLKISDKLKVFHALEMEGSGTAGKKRPVVAVSYFPEGEAVTSSCDNDDETLVCKSVDEVSLVVLEEGGTISLTCEGCTPQKPVSVMMQ